MVIRVGCLKIRLWNSDEVYVECGSGSEWLRGVEYHWKTVEESVLSITYIHTENKTEDREVQMGQVLKRMPVAKSQSP